MKTIKRIILQFTLLSGTAHVNRMICFAKGYLEAGIEVEVICLGLKGAKSLEIEGVKIRFINESRGANKLIRRIRDEIKIIRAIKEDYNPIDTVIHIYRTPVWAFCLSKRKYDFFLERGEVPFYINSFSIKYYIEEWLGRMVTKKATGLLAQTNALKEYYQNYGVKYIDVNNMFVDESRFEGLMRTTNDKYIVYCGSVSKHKDGVDDLIKAFKIVHDRFSDWKLKIIGGFLTKDDEKCLIELVHKLKIENNVIFTGRVEISEMPSLLCQACILALARPKSKQAKYGFPTKVGEYLCTNIPSVLTRVGEIEYYIKDMVHCVFAEPDNPLDFANKIIWIIEHPFESKKIAENGKKLLSTDFSMVSQSHRALEFMQRVINIR